MDSKTTQSKFSQEIKSLLEQLAHQPGSSHIWQVNGACISWLTFLLMLPLPMTNPIPTIGILMIAIATLEADSLMMGLGYAATGLTTGLFGVIGYGLWRSPDLIMRWIS